jgi:hypothetical protein
MNAHLLQPLTLLVKKPTIIVFWWIFAFDFSQNLQKTLNQNIIL